MACYAHIGMRTIVGFGLNYSDQESLEFDVISS